MFSASNIQFEIAEKTRAIDCEGIGTMLGLAKATGLVDAINNRIKLLKHAIHAVYWLYQFCFRYDRPSHPVNGCVLSIVRLEKMARQRFLSGGYCMIRERCAATPMFLVELGLVVLASIQLVKSAEIATDDAERTIRNRIAADHKAVAAVRREVADKLEKTATKQFLDPRQEVKLSPTTVAPNGKWVLWYQQPGAYWTDALPLGNGRLGAMVFGGVKREIVQLNEDTLWSGKPIDRAKPGAVKYLEKARQLLFDGEYEEGQKLVYEKIMGRRLNRGIHTYQALGNITLDFEYTAASATQYQRSLDLDTGIVTVSYTAGDVGYRREVFITAPDQLAVMRLSADTAGALSFRLSLTRERDATVAVAGNDRLVMTGHADGGSSVRFAAQLRVILHGGRCVSDGNRLRIDHADSAVILLAAATDYAQKDRTRVVCQNGPQADFHKRRLLPSLIAERQLEAAAQKPYEVLLQAHVCNHRALFRRVELDLGRTVARTLPTDKRIAALRAGNEDPELLALHFQFGRYLLMASSRPGTMPANLQGIWAGGMTPPWNADFHLNINLQMNYWPAEVCNLSECHEPMFDLIDALRPRGRKTARETYGCRGWVAHHTTDAWWFADVIGLPQYGMWVMGAAWCCQHLWEHYQFTRDRPFLAQRAYPAMKEAAVFLLDWLVEDPRTGRLISGPSTSPENIFISPDWKQYGNLSMGPTMDHMIIRDLFTNCIEASKTLAVDVEFREELEEALARLTPIPIDAEGRIREWLEPFHDYDPGHRHMSHLFGLYPGRQITESGTPDLFQAARKSIEGRLASKFHGVGWSHAWLVSFFARLKDGDAAHDHLQLLVGRASKNLFNGKFQIDANFGATAGLAEMLLQSHQGYIELLPALPKAWATGSASGLRARGDITLDIRWTDGRLDKAIVHAGNNAPNTVGVVYGGKKNDLTLAAGQTATLSRTDFRGPPRVTR